MEGIEMQLRTLGKVDLGMTIQQNSLEKGTGNHKYRFGRSEEDGFKRGERPFVRKKGVRNEQMAVSCHLNRREISDFDKKEDDSVLDICTQAPVTLTFLVSGFRQESRALLVSSGVFRLGLTSQFVLWIDVQHFPEGPLVMKLQGNSELKH